jgi:hypothetical protein
MDQQAENQIKHLEIIADLLDTEKHSLSPYMDHTFIEDNISQLGKMNMQELGQKLLEPIIEIKEYEGFMPKCLSTPNPRIRLPEEKVVKTQDLIDQGAKVFPIEIKFLISTKKIAPAGFPDVNAEQLFQPQQFTEPKIMLRQLSVIQTDLRRQLEYEEDVALMQIIEKFAQQTSISGLGDEFLDAIVGHARVLVNRALLRRIQKSEITLNQVDLVGHRELIQAGYVGRVMNADIVCAPAVHKREPIRENKALLMHKEEEYPVFGIWQQVSPVTIEPITYCGVAVFAVQEKLEYVILDPDENFTIVEIGE